MGKRSKPPGLPKKTPTKKQREQITARAMLLGATWDDPTNMFIKTDRHDNGPGMIPSHWTTYFNVNGVELSLKEAKKRIAAAEKRSIMGRGKYRANRGNRSKSMLAGLNVKLWQDKFMKDFGVDMGVPVTSQGKL